MASKQMTKPKTKTEEKKETPGFRPAPLVQPTLDHQHRMMLDGKRDRVDGLSCITVKFFPHGLQEVTYTVTGEDGDSMDLSTTGFLSFLGQKKKESKSEHEITASKGFFTKVYKRALVDIGEDSVENVRKVQAGPIPKAASSILSKTQEEMKIAKLNEQQGILAHWAKMPEAVVIQMEDWQKLVNPAAPSWKANLNALINRANEEEKTRAAKKLAKTIGIAVASKIDGEPTELEKAMAGSSAGFNGSSKPDKRPTAVQWADLNEQAGKDDEEEELNRSNPEQMAAAIAKPAAKEQNV